MDEEEGPPRGREERPQVGVVTGLAMTIPIVATAATTDEEIDAVVAAAAAVVAEKLRAAIRRARREALAAEAALGGTGPYGFPTGLAACEAKEDDPPPIDPISARMRDHPRVRAVYESDSWFGGPGGPRRKE